MCRTRVYIFVAMVAAAAYLGLAVVRLRNFDSPGWPYDFPLPDRLLNRMVDWCGGMPAPPFLFSVYPIGIMRTESFLGIAEASCLLAAMCMLLPAAKGLLPRRTVPGECPNCGYDLIASIGAGKTECPECGFAYEPQAVLSDQLDASRRRRFVRLAGRVAWAHWLLVAGCHIALMHYLASDTLIMVAGAVGQILAMPAGLMRAWLYWWEPAWWAALAGNSVLWGVVVAAVWDRWRHGRRRKNEPVQARGSR